MMANLHCARDLQEMRIKKKYRQNVSPQPGSLYIIKTSARNRISLKTAVEEETPSFHSTQKVYVLMMPFRYVFEGVSSLKLENKKTAYLQF